MADASDSKSDGGNLVRVQVPPPAPQKRKTPSGISRTVSFFCYAYSFNGHLTIIVFVRASDSFTIILTASFSRTLSRGRRDPWRRRIRCSGGRPGRICGWRPFRAGAPHGAAERMRRERMETAGARMTIESAAHDAQAGSCLPLQGQELGFDILKRRTLLLDEPRSMEPVPLFLRPGGGTGEENEYKKTGYRKVSCFSFVCVPITWNRVRRCTFR